MRPAGKVNSSQSVVYHLDFCYRLRAELRRQEFFMGKVTLIGKVVSRLSTTAQADS